MAVEQHDGAQAQPERRGGDTGHGQGAGNLVNGAVVVHRRQHTQRHTDHNGEKQRHQGQLQSGREKRLQVFQHRAVGADRGAQVALHQVEHVTAVLLVQRQIQPQLMADAGHQRIAGPVTGDQPGRVAGNQVGNGKGNQRDTEHDQ